MARQEQERLRASQRREEKRAARLIARRRRQEMLQQKRLAFARVKHGRLRLMVQLLQTGFQKSRSQSVLKAWGVPELKEYN